MMRSDQLLTLFLSILLFVIIVKMPKRMSYSEMYVTSLFAYGLGVTVDLFFEFKFGLYYLSGKGVQYTPVIASIILYSLLNILIINFYPYKKTILRKFLYIIFCSLLSLFGEYMAVTFGLIKYSGWKWYFSAVSYPMIILVLLWNRQFVRKLISLDKFH